MQDVGGGWSIINGGSRYHAGVIFQNGVRRLFRLNMSSTSLKIYFHFYVYRLLLAPFWRALMSFPTSLYWRVSMQMLCKFHVNLLSDLSNDHFFRLRIHFFPWNWIGLGTAAQAYLRFSSGLLQSFITIPAFGCIQVIFCWILVLFATDLRQTQR